MVDSYGTSSSGARAVGRGFYRQPEGHKKQKLLKLIFLATMPLASIADRDYVKPSVAPCNARLLYPTGRERCSIDGPDLPGFRPFNWSEWYENLSFGREDLMEER